MTTKLHIPRERADLVPRPRLVQRLSAGLDLKLTLFSAPAGFGKTTLLSEWIRQAGRPVAWLSLDADDNDPARFAGYLVAALQTAEPGLARDLLSRFPPPSLPGQAGPEWLPNLMVSLINELAGLAQPLILVLDDYHALDVPQVHQAVALLIEHGPPALHLAIAGRVDPPLPLSRLRARRQLTEIGEAELRFTPEEAGVFLNQVMRLGLAPDDVGALATRTEGWIAGLQLAALALQSLLDGQGGMPGLGRAGVRSFIQAFTGSHRYVLDYLVDEVLSRQPAPIQRFLLQTAILDRLAGGLCDALTGGSDGQAILERLEAANLFIIPLDGERRWYRYHSLFADLLRHRLEVTMPGQVPELHRRASEWYANNERVYEAMGHALAAQDYERAAALVEATGPSMAMRGEAATLLAWMDSLPGHVVRSRPRLSLAYAWMLFVTSNMEAIEPHLQDALHALATGQEPGWALPSEMYLQEVATLRAFVAVYYGEPQRAVELCMELLATLSGENPLARAGAYSVLGDAYVHLDQLVEAQGAYEAALQWSLAANNRLLSKVMINDLARLKVVQGRLREAARQFGDVLEWGGRQRVPLYPVGQAYVGLGDILREWNDLEAAESHLRAGFEHCERGGYTRYAMAGALSLARMMAARGDGAAVLELLERAVQLARRTGVPAFAAQVAAHEARLWLMPGLARPAPAERWLKEAGLQPTDRPGYAAELQYLTLVRVWLARSRQQADLSRPGVARSMGLEPVRDLLAWLLAAAEAAGRQRSAAKVLALLALTWQAEGEPGRALEALERALALAEPEGYVRTFVDEGPPMAGLLGLAAGRGIQPSYVARLVAALGPAAAPRAAAARTEPGTPFAEPLSEREREVLHLLAAGLSNAEIAGQLVITLSTVKAHVRSIFRKLDVENRTQAAALARKLDLD